MLSPAAKQHPPTTSSRAKGQRPAAGGNAPVEMTNGDDRLSVAKNFANELNDSRLWKIKISYQKRWTKHRRAQKAMEIQTTRPWLRATGPKTAAGKRRAARNADKGRGRSAPDILTRMLFSAMRDQKYFLYLVRAYCKRPPCGPEQERRWMRILSYYARFVTRRLLRVQVLMELAGGPENYVFLHIFTNVTGRNNQ